MKVKIVKKLFTEWERIEFPMFPKGVNVIMNEEEDKSFQGWHEAKIEGHQTFIPHHIVCDGKLTRDYNPTELVGEIGDIIEIQEVHNAWLLATNKEGITGWIPAEKVVSV
ncbi:MAG: SH3 domain-containing protein [Defluviitaleaceae bacterium]|nr:SH3 domain-containing protein [Defluviitaleaceae bacterium]